MKKNAFCWMMAGCLALGLVAPALAEAEAAPADRHWYDRVELDWKFVGVLQGTSGVRPALNPGKNDVTANGLMKMDFNFDITPHSAVGGQIKASGGNGLDGLVPAISYSGFNATGDDDQALRLSKFWYDQSCFHDVVRFTVGKLDMTQDFDCNTLANDEDVQFLSGAFVNNRMVEFPGNAAAGQVWITPTEWLAIGGGISDAAGNWDHVFQQAFSIVEADVTANFGGRAGHYRFYGWQNRTWHVGLLDPTDTPNHNSGWGLSIDQELSDIVSLFGRYGQQRARLNNFSRAFSVGAQFHCRPFGRVNDVIGVAYGQSMLGSQGKQALRAVGVDPGNEVHVEAYYSCKANDHLSLSPDIQWQRNANGDRAFKSIWAFAARATLEF